jgi:hypothetical protein
MCSPEVDNSSYQFYLHGGIDKFKYKFKFKKFLLSFAKSLAKSEPLKGTLA